MTKEANALKVVVSRILIPPKKESEKQKVFSYQTLTEDRKFYTDLPLAWHKKVIIKRPF